MHWIRSDLLPIREERPTHTIFYEPARAPLSPAGGEAAARLLRACDRLVQSDRTTLFESWCIADPDLALMLQRLNKNGHTLPDKVRRYAEANWERASVRKWWDRPRPPYEPY
jgi:glutathione S-transferase